MTKKEMFAALMTIVENSNAESKTELLEGIQHELNLLAKKSSAPKKPTKVQIENEGIAKHILEVMESGNPITVSDLLAKLGDSTLTNQRVTHILTKLVSDGAVVRDVVKRKAFYVLAD